MRIATRNNRTVYEDSAPSVRETVENAVRAGVSLREADLFQAPLAGLALDGAIFNQAVLDCADLTGASLRNANFVDAELNSAVLINADLHKANFTDASLEYANLGGASLVEAIFVRTRLTHATLDRADITGCYFSGGPPVDIGLSRCVVQKNRQPAPTPLRIRYTSPASAFANSRSGAVDPHARCAYYGTCVANMIDPHTRACDP